MKELSIPEAIQKMVDGDKVVAVDRVSGVNFYAFFKNGLFYRQNLDLTNPCSIIIFDDYIWYTKQGE